MHPDWQMNNAPHKSNKYLYKLDIWARGWHGLQWNGALRQECEWEFPCICGTWVRNALAVRAAGDMLLAFGSYALAELDVGALRQGRRKPRLV